MIALETVSSALVICLFLYLVMGGADFGGGIVDLFTFGPLKEKQQTQIRETLAPIWEANHVWLILIVVVLFTAFPKAFAYFCTVLHVPITLMLLGIVFRGAAFAFEKYDPATLARRRWKRWFNYSSLLTPFFLGVLLGAITEGRLPAPGQITTPDFFLTWISPLTISVGIFTVVLCFFLAAVYLTCETSHLTLAQDFAHLAKRSEIFLVFAGGVVLFIGRFAIFQTLIGIAILTLTSLLMLLTAFFLDTGRFRWAKLTAPSCVALILLGWVCDQLPFLIRPHFTFAASAANEITLNWLAWSLGIGALLLVPALRLLFKIPVC